MSKDSESQVKHETLTTAIKTVTKSWEVMKNELGLYREEIAETFFTTQPLRRNLFNAPKIGQNPTEEALQKKFFKHSTAVVNCLEALVEFINGNEESKPILFVLGKHHKLLNVTEKMFMEMKDAICKVVRNHMEAENSKAWEIVIEYIYSNYVFQGMHMIETL